MEAQEKIRRTLAWLDDSGVAYELVTHVAVYTIEEMDKAGVNEKGNVAKDLFLRDDKGRRHFLVVTREDKHADLKALGAKLGTKLSFASPERLEKYLNLTKGSVTPLGILFDENAAVEIFLDRDLDTDTSIGVHPCDNTATVFLRFADLVRLIEKNENPCTVLPL